MHYSYDAEVDALYISLLPDAEVVRTIEFDDSRHVDLDALGQVSGIEILWASEGVELNDIIDRFQLFEEKEFLHQVASIDFSRAEAL
jgi:uncharacterized protein YuzE